MALVRCMKCGTVQENPTKMKPDKFNVTGCVVCGGIYCEYVESKGSLC